MARRSWQALPLVGLLDAFGGDDQSQSVTQPGQRPHDGSAFVFRSHIPNEASVDLNRIEFEIS